MQKDGVTWGRAGATAERLGHSDDRMSCYACHSSWMTSCFGCHLSMKANANRPTLHNEGDVDSRNFTRASFGAALAGPSTLDAIRDIAPGRGYPSTLDFVAGTAAWLLGCVAILRRRVPAALLALGAIGLVLSFEPPPFDRAVAHVPLLRDILPRYYWPLVMLPIACAAGAGADALAKADRAFRGVVAAAAVFTGVTLAALGISTFGPPELPKAWARIVADLPEPRPSWLRYHLIVLGGLALVAATARFTARRGAMALLVIVTADVVFLMRPHLREKPAGVLHRPLPAPVLRLASATASAHARIAGAIPGISVASWPLLAGLADIRMTAPLIPARYHAFLLAAGLDEQSTRSCCVFFLPATRSPWADLAAVRFIVADAATRGSVASDPTMSVNETLPRSTVFENHAAFGRARLFFGASVASSQDDAVAMLRTLARGGDHIGATLLGETVILEPSGKIAPTPLDGEGSAEVQWIRDEPDEVILETDGPSAGYLMLADTYYPGWRATVDGSSVPIFPADVAFRAVQVAPGRHTVRFVYRPVSMWSGVALFAAAMIAALIAIRRDRSNAAQLVR